MTILYDARGNEITGSVLDQITNGTVTDARTITTTLSSLNAEAVMDLNGQAVAMFDLRTGALSEHSADDRITKLVPVPYAPSAPCPQWQTFLERIFGCNAQLIAYVQRCIGYALTGDVGEKAMFVLYGKGDNGKTTLLEAVRQVLGQVLQLLQ